MDETITSLMGCVEILKDMDNGDARLWTVISSIQRAIETLEHLDEPDLVPAD